MIPCPAKCQDGIRRAHHHGTICKICNGAGEIEGQQPPPTPNAAPPIFEAVIADMRERAEAGRAQYGTYLQPHNGRDSLRDWYEELLDAAQYARQAMMERDAMVEVMNDLHARVHSDICGKRCCSECVAYRELMANV